MKTEFWKDWKRKTKIEESAIKSLMKGIKIILENIPKDQIIAIYVKGSFPRREMNDKSDVDTFTILKTNKYLPKLKKLEEKHRDKFKPQIQFTGYSLSELKSGKKNKRGKKMRPSPSRTVKHLKHYKHLHGTLLNPEDFPIRTDKKDLEGLIGAFKKLFLPGYKKKDFGFSEILKQVFWLVENEQRVRGENPPDGWKKLARSIKDKKHVIHDTIRLRLNPTKDKNLRGDYIKKLEKYLGRLEKIK